MTSRGQTPYPISTIFNRLPEGPIDNMLMKKVEAASKTVGAGLFTDRHIPTHTDSHPPHAHSPVANRRVRTRAPPDTASRHPSRALGPARTHFLPPPVPAASLAKLRVRQRHHRPAAAGVQRVDVACSIVSVPLFLHVEPQ